MKLLRTPLTRRALVLGVWAGLILCAHGQFTPSNADRPPTISISDITVVEGGSVDASINFTLTLSRTSAVPVSVTCVTSNGTAQAGEDFLAVSDLVRFPPGATSATFQVPLLNDADHEPDEFFHVFLAHSTNATIGAGSAIGIILDDDAPAPPVITVQPRTQILGVGSKAAFRVSVAGSRPLSYQWTLNGTILADDTRIEGATGPVLTIGGVQSADQFYYVVTVTNQEGRVVSLPASLWVLEPPCIISQPVEQAVLVGAPALFRVQATGIDPLRYQWRRNGTNLPGATEATLTLGNVTSPAVSRINVLVSDAVGTSTSRVAILRVLRPPTITTQPAGVILPLGAPGVTFDVAATGTPPLQYQWRLNGAHIPGATNSSYTIAPVELAYGGSYTVVVANEAGAVLSEAALLLFDDIPGEPPARDNLNDPAVPFSSPEGILQGSNALATREPAEPFHAGKPGDHSVWFTWIAPATGIATFSMVGSAFDTLLGAYVGSSFASLSRRGADDDRGGFLTSRVQFNADAGTTYQIAIDGLAGQNGPFVLSWVLEITPETVPMILSSPANLTVHEGEDVTLTVAASGVPPLSFQWLRNGIPLASAIGTTLALPGVRAENVGDYSVLVANAFGRTAESQPDSLQLGLETTAQARGKWECLLSLGGDGGAGAGGGLRAAAAPVPQEFVIVRTGVPDLRTFNGNVSSGGSYLHCLGSPQAMQWMKLKTTNDGDFRIDTIGSEVPTILAIFASHQTGYPAVPPIACATNNTGDGRGGSVMVPASAGAIYWAMVDRLTSVGGAAKLNWLLGQRPRSANPTNVQFLIKQPGDTPQLDAGITGTPDPAPAFQWFREGRPMAGETNSVLRLSALTNRDSGHYSVRASNALGVIESAWCLRVGTGVAFEIGQTNSAGTPLMHVTSGAAQDFVLQAAPDLNPSIVWTNLIQKIGPDCFHYFWPLQNPTVPSQGFFRATNAAAP